MRRIMKGIPDSLRGKAWQRLLDPAFEVEASNRPTIEAMVSIRRPACCDTLEVDLTRTMPKMAMFSSAMAREGLRNVLHAYSVTDIEIGYVQGMAFPAAMLLAYLPEQPAFYCFLGLMSSRKIQLRWLYANNFQGLGLLNKVWDWLLADRFKKIDQTLKSGGIISGLYTTQWFLTVFAAFDFPSEVRVRLFDRYVAFGTRTLLSFALVIVALHRAELESKSAMECLGLFQKPDKSPLFRDWRKVMATFDQMWLSDKEYKKAFKMAGVPLA